MPVETAENLNVVRIEQRHQDQDSLNLLVDQGVDPLLAALFAARGVKDISEVRGGMDDIHPTSSLENCDLMASALADCVVRQSRVLIICDYDCDGATAGAILLAAFRSCGMNVDIFVPDRKRHGYGLAESVVLEASDLPVRPDVIITVDSGITSNAGVKLANELGIRVLITDHHASPEVLPDAELIVNPNQPSCNFPSKSMAGCGVAWYLAKSLAQELSDRDVEPGFDPVHLLQFLAIGTIADVVNLDRNNRILVAEGLKRIRSGECTEGIKALMAVSATRRDTLSCKDIGYGIAPRLNAAGRLSHMEMGVKLLLTMRSDIAWRLAEQLDDLNRQRKQIEKQIADEATPLMESHLSALDETAGKSGKNTIVVFHPDWHEGVIGIVASRLKERQHRPAFVVCTASDGSMKASGRSIPGFHLKHALDEVAVSYPGVIVKHGGHPMAVGVVIAQGMLEKFKFAIEEVSKKYITPQMLDRVWMHDGEYPFADLSVEKVKMLNKEVWGQGFPEPTFIGTMRVLKSRTVGSEKSHLSADVEVGGREMKLIAFGEGAVTESSPAQLTMLYRPEPHRAFDEEDVQIVVTHLPSQNLTYKLDLSAETIARSERALASIVDCNRRPVSRPV